MIRSMLFHLRTTTKIYLMVISMFSSHSIIVLTVITVDSTVVVSSLILPSVGGVGAMFDPCFVVQYLVLFLGFNSPPWGRQNLLLCFNCL